MNYTFPYTIENSIGEKVVFHSVEPSTGKGDKLIFEGFYAPGAGPIMHTHFKQDESITVITGNMGYQFWKQESGFAKPEAFDGAYLVTRYASEYDLPEIPKFVKKVIIPLTYLTGKILGKYKHFKNAPPPLT